MRAFRSTRSAVLAAGLLLVLCAPVAAQSDTLLLLQSGSPPGNRLVVDSAGGLVVGGTYGVGAIPATGTGVRLMWYPHRAAFRAGRVTGTQWNDASVGPYSAATGYNTVASGWYSTAMGYGTTASAWYSAAMGYNTTASGYYSTALGTGTTASGDYSIAMGYGTTASGWHSAAIGHTTTASGYASTAMGTGTTASGPYSTAIGRRASTHDHPGSFVYGDATNAGDTVRATAAHQATWRTTGGFRVFTNSGLTTGCSIATGGSAWVCTSSRMEKENFAAVDGEDVLRRLRSVPVTSWNGIAEGPQVRHIGPMAQDWHAAFALNDDPLTINQGDLAGVSLAAVQALDGRTLGVPEMERELARLREEAAEQRARLERLEAVVAALIGGP